ncbi:MAG: hypothetical protein WBH01_04955 [Dehalococcoidia bacterium]
MMIDWLWGAIAAIGGIIIALLIAVFFIASAFTLLAAKIVKVENATFGRAMLATFLGSLAGGAASFVLGLLFGPLLVAGAVLSTIGAYLVDSLVVKAIFGTSYGKGLLITLLARVLAAAVAIVIGLIVVGTSSLSCGL